MNLQNKWLEYEDSYEMVLRLRETGIKTCGFFIIGYPGETYDDMERTLEFANSLPLDQRNIYIATPYPGTPLFRYCKLHSYIEGDSKEFYRNLLYSKALISTPEFTAKGVAELRDRDRNRARRRNSLN